jgi:hypothetical protein
VINQCTYSISIINQCTYRGPGACAGVAAAKLAAQDNGKRAACRHGRNRCSDCGDWVCEGTRREGSRYSTPYDAIHSLYTRYTLTMRPIYTHHTFTIHSAKLERANDAMELLGGEHGELVQELDGLR